MAKTDAPTMKAPVLADEPDRMAWARLDQSARKIVERFGTRVCRAFIDAERHDNMAWLFETAGNIRAKPEHATAALRLVLGPETHPS